MCALVLYQNGWLLLRHILHTNTNGKRVVDIDSKEPLGIFKNSRPPKSLSKTIGVLVSNTSQAAWGSKSCKDPLHLSSLGKKNTGVSESIEGI